MKHKVLITGGAGFIGCHVARALLERGYSVRMLDSLIEQVHGDQAAPNPILREVELLEGDVRNLDLVKSALAGVGAVIHLAAEVGVGQSMYAISRYVAANDLGTAVLLEALLEHPVARVVVASSMSIYGEGLYRTSSGEIVETAARSLALIQAGKWDPVDDAGAALDPVPTPEWKRPSLASVYAVTKFAQEQFVLTVGAAYGWEPVALRLFNVFGPGQALSNPYTGVLAIFASRLLNGQRPVAFEDGRQRRDFVHVADVADAFVLALETAGIGGRVFNVGSGRSYSVVEVAQLLAGAMGRPHLEPEIVGKARAGDIRHCFSDISAAQAQLRFWPRRPLEDSLGELAEWVERQSAIDRVPNAQRELEQRGLIA